MHATKHGPISRHTKLVLGALAAGLVTASQVAVAVIYYRTTRTTERPIGGLALITASIWAAVTIHIWVKAYLERTGSCAAFHGTRVSLAVWLMPACMRHDLYTAARMRTAQSAAHDLINSLASDDTATQDQALAQLRDLGAIVLRRGDDEL